ncbi:hypothetical protein RJT34_23220 [Clitoria ternatea]|uniref:Uncharacterized protein n=1 Tax=Clitoria ternatea TaxID=43366 RepID=A0AAN9FL77_CLITE
MVVVMKMVKGCLWQGWFTSQGLPIQNPRSQIAIPKPNTQKCLPHSSKRRRRQGISFERTSNAVVSSLKPDHATQQ